MPLTAALAAFGATTGMAVLVAISNRWHDDAVAVILVVVLLLFVAWWPSVGRGRNRTP